MFLDCMFIFYLVQGGDGDYLNQNQNLLDLTTANRDICTANRVVVTSTYHNLLKIWDSGMVSVFTPHTH